MVILQFIMGFIMGVCLMAIVSGHLITKKALAPIESRWLPLRRARGQKLQKPF
jgi:hypothetical protein